MSKQAHERRALPGAELRVVGEGKDRKLIGYAAVFDSMSVDLGGFREQIRPGAFSRSLGADADVAALVDHDPSKIIGRRSSGTLKVAEDDRGLRVEISPPDTTVGRDLMTSVERGDVSSMSFGFTVAENGDEWQRDRNGNEIRTLVDVDLFDVSAVTYPAYPDTTVAIRSRNTWKGSTMETRQEGVQPQPTPTALKTAIDTAIEALTTEERPRETIVAELTEATGAPDVVAAIDANDLICPTIDALDLMAGVLEIDVADLQSAAEADGCTYEEADDAEDMADAGEPMDEAPMDGEGASARYDDRAREDRLLEIQSQG